MEARLARFVAMHDRALAPLGPRVEYGPALRQRLRGAPGGPRREGGAPKRGPERDNGRDERMSKARDNKKLIVGLDVGTSKIAAIVAEVKPEGGFEIIGMGSHPSRGLKKGVVVNIETTVNAIQRALEEAELMADCKIREVYTGIAGSHIRSFNSQGMVAVKDKEVALADIERVVDTARAVQIPNDQQILHILNQEFIIDGQEDVREPLGMSGVRLEVKVHIVTGAVSAAQNIVKCVRRCGLEVRDLVLQPLASAMAVISDDEKDLGVALVDIGGGTSDLVVFTHGAIRHTAVIPIAGDQITNDIAMALRTPTKDAEDIKERCGCALSQLADPQEMVEVPGLGERDPRQLSRKTLAEVIEPRVEELYSLVQTELRRSGYEELLSSGVVITGGSSVMQGMVELGEEIFHMPVRVGYPAYHGALAEAVRHPRHSTGVGLLLAGMQQLRSRELARMNAGSFRQVLDRMKTWFTGNF
jgi:cell division protein FtsA